MKRTLSTRHAVILFIIAFTIRAAVMAFVIQPNNYYKQSDSTDYHNCALMIATGHGMHRADINEPIFWRTPGYPPYLALFYKLVGVTHGGFQENKTAQLLSLWVQIIVSSCIPIILFYLTYLLIPHITVATIIAWISVFHPGLVLATTYLLTEGLALIFFYLFLLFLFRILLSRSGSNIIPAALTLAIYTWMRPMGEFIALFTILLIALFAAGSWIGKLKQALLFGLLFFACIAPWYIRNNQLTGQWFFCPTIGTYLTCFSVPKILRRALDKPIEECHAIAQHHAALEVQKERLKLAGTGLHVSNNACKNAAYPLIMQYPGYFMYDWMMEVVKTTFDLYSYQMVSMINGSYWYDPIEEYLPTKIADCLYAQPMPWYVRLISWFELIASIIIWLGLLEGTLIVLVRPLFTRTLTFDRLQLVWFASLLLIGIIVGMTGGFGYARLRLPAEPLILILAVSYWFFIYQKRTVIRKVLS